MTRRQSGAAAQGHGAELEAELDRYHRRLRIAGRYVIRTGQPMRAVHRRSGVVWLPIPGAGGVPDYHALTPAGMVAFDAKSCAGDRWGFELLDPGQAASFGLVDGAGGVAAVYLRMGGRDWWLPWTRLGERWWEWAGKVGRAAPGSASIGAGDCADIGREISGCDWWREVTGEGGCEW